MHKNLKLQLHNYYQKSPILTLKYVPHLTILNLADWQVHWITTWWQQQAGLINLVDKMATSTNSLIYVKAVAVGIYKEIICNCKVKLLTLQG